MDSCSRRRALSCSLAPGDPAAAVAAGSSQIQRNLIANFMGLKVQ